jgi:transcriptional regulator with XRE-family HTH domain
MARGLGLREVARRIELSASSISQIETGKSRPSVRTLYALASELGVTIDDFLLDEPPTHYPAASERRVEPELVLQRSAGRPAIQLSSGVCWKRLMFWADKDIEFMEAVYEPGGASSPGAPLVGHSGHEFVHVLTGTLRIVVGLDEYVLEPGDSITFPSSTPHRLSNEGIEAARAIWVVSGHRGTKLRHRPTEAHVIGSRAQRKPNG